MKKLLLTLLIATLIACPSRYSLQKKPQPHVTYWENGKIKTQTGYQSDGTKLFFDCFDNNGDRMFCHPITHDLPISYITVTYHDTPKNTSVASYIHYRDMVKMTKLQEYTYRKNNKAKTKTTYQSDGKTKASESTYWENGKKKTEIGYQSDGKTKGSESTYWENGKPKTEIGYRYEGVKLSWLTYWKTGKPKTEIGYRYDGTKSSDFTYWKNGNLKTQIDYRSDGETKRKEWAFTDSGKEKTGIEYHADGKTKKHHADFYENGNPKQIKVYDNRGRRLALENLWPSGTIKKEIIYEPPGFASNEVCYSEDGESVTCPH